MQLDCDASSDVDVLKVEVCRDQLIFCYGKFSECFSVLALSSITRPADGRQVEIAAADSDLAVAKF